MSPLAHMPGDLAGQRFTNPEGLEQCESMLVIVCHSVRMPGGQFNLTPSPETGSGRVSSLCFEAVQLMLSTDPSDDNRTITSTLKMQIWIATNNRDVPRVTKTKFPATVMVFGVVFKWGPHHATSHLRRVGVIPWCNQVTGSRPWVWQQDSAPAHKSKETQAWFQKECYDFVPFSHWSPSSPDLNPLDYFVWSYVENITNMTSHNTKASLIAAIRRLFAELPPALVEKACSKFRIRIEAVIEAEGGYIECYKFKLPELIFSIKVLK